MRRAWKLASASATEAGRLTRRALHSARKGDQLLEVLVREVRHRELRAEGLELDRTAYASSSWWPSGATEPAHHGTGDSTTPSASRPRSASRTGAWLMPSSRATRVSTIRESGVYRAGQDSLEQAMPSLLGEDPSRESRSRRHCGSSGPTHPPAAHGRRRRAGTNVVCWCAPAGRPRATGAMLTVV